MLSTLVMLTLLSLLLAIAIGANDETYAPVLSAKKLSLNQTVLLASLTIIIGASTLGLNVARTVGTKISTTETTIQGIFTILIAVAIVLIIGSLMELPLSTTHAMVGSTIAMAVMVGSPDALQKEVVIKIVLSWVMSPIFGLLAAFILQFLLDSFKRRYIKGLDDVDRIEGIFSVLLIIAVVFTSISRGANDVSNAVAPILPAYIDLAESTSNDLYLRLPLFLGGFFMGIGLIFIGRRVLASLANNLVEMSPTTALAVQIATGVVTTIAAVSGIPISGTHVLVSAFIGSAVASGRKVNYKSLLKIGLSAIFTPFAAALVTYLVWQGVLIYW